MRNPAELFTEHPASVGEGYFTHMRMALGFAGGCMAASLACLVHAFLPFACIKTGSRKITALHDRMVTHRDRRHAESPRQSQGQLQEQPQGHPAAAE